MLKLYPLLKNIDKRPAMWIWENRLEAIYTYIPGYYHTLLDNSIIDTVENEEPFFTG